MGNAYFFYIFPMLTGLFFFTAGVVLLLKVLRGDHDSKGRKYGFVEGCISVVIAAIGGTVAFGILCTSPPPWQRQALFDHIFHTPPEQIVEITLLPSNYKPLVGQPVKIVDPMKLREIAGVLSSAQDFSLNHPRTMWTALVELHTTGGVYRFSVSSTDSDRNGTFLTPMYGGNWNLGAFRADGLRVPFEAAASAAGKKKPGVL